MYEVSKSKKHLLLAATMVNECKIRRESSFHNNFWGQHISCWLYFSVSFYLKKKKLAMVNKVQNALH